MCVFGGFGANQVGVQAGNRLVLLWLRTWCLSFRTIFGLWRVGKVLALQQIISERALKLRGTLLGTFAVIIKMLSTGLSFYKCLSNRSSRFEDDI